MPEDHLGQETSLSAELTETGVKAAAKSRTVASIDRLIGNIADVGSAWIEGVNARRRAKNEGERKFIEAAARYGLERMRSDDAFANRAFENHYRKVVQQQINKDAVVAEALEDLRQNPPTDEEASSGPETVSEEFLNRFEGYAEGATTDQLRQRWGRILASEIRKPGTFSPKVLRTTDELDAETASLFESLMRYRTGDILIECLMPKLTLNQRLQLVSAGLMVDPGFTGHRQFFGQGVYGSEDAWATSFGSLLVTFPKSAEIPQDKNKLIGRLEEGPTYDVLILTDVGEALSAILPSYEEALGLEYALKLRDAMGPVTVRLWSKVSTGEHVSIPFPES